MTKSLGVFLATLAWAMETSAAWAEGGATPCGAAKKPSIHPTFCSIPATPTDVRNADAYKSTVVDIRRAGLRLTSTIARERFSLRIGDTEDFAGLARAEAAPPGNEAAVSSDDTKAFEADALRRLGAPSKPRP